MRVPRLVVGGHEGAPVGELGALGRTGSTVGWGLVGTPPGRTLVRPLRRGDPSGQFPGGPWQASHLEEGVGAGAVEAVGPGVERGHKGAAFQGAAPGAGPLLALPAPHRALAGGGGRATRVVGAPPGVLGQQSWLLRAEAAPDPHAPVSPPPLLSLPGAAGVGCDLPRGVGHAAERAGALGDGHAGEVFGNVVENHTCRQGLPGAAWGRPHPSLGLPACAPGACFPSHPQSHLVCMLSVLPPRADRPRPRAAPGERRPVSGPARPTSSQ